MGKWALSNIQATEGPRASLDCFTLRFNSLFIRLSSLGKKHSDVQSILIELFKIPEIQHLISQAFRGKSFSVQFTEERTLYSGGDCDFTTNTIHIAKELSIPSIVSTLIFELCNASNPILEDTLHDSYNSADSYAFAIEQAEYLTYQRHIALLDILVKNTAFISALRRIAGDSNIIENEISTAHHSFEEYWLAANITPKGKSYSHAESYRRHYHLTENLHDTYAIWASYLPKFSTKEEPHDALSALFTSPSAQVLLDIIRENPQALLILKECSPAIALTLAQKATPQNVMGFKALNRAEQVLFVSQFVQREMQLALRTKVTVA